MNANTQVTVAAMSLPGSIFIMSAVGGATAAMTSQDQDAIKRSMGVTAVAMLIAAAATGNLATLLTTAMAIGGVFFAMRSTWSVPFN